MTPFAYPSDALAQRLISAQAVCDSKDRYVAYGWHPYMRLIIFRAYAVGAFSLRQPFDRRFPPLDKLGNRQTRGTNRAPFLFNCVV
jgi:hypothetical protein